MADLRGHLDLGGFSFENTRRCVLVATLAFSMGSGFVLCACAPGTLFLLAAA